MIGRDVADSGPIRAQHREAHVAHVRKLFDEGRIIMAGPIREPAGETSIGAVIILEADDLAHARQIVEDDPYVKAGVFAQLTVDRFRQFLPPTA
jgi:uncharacterized protein YciI